MLMMSSCRYPFVDFNSASQKLALGTPEGASIIYDLRTATRCLVLEVCIIKKYFLAPHRL